MSPRFASTRHSPLPGRTYRQGGRHCSAVRGLLLVPQFTLAADTGKGARPSFTPAAAPAVGKALFEYLLGRAQAGHAQVAAGRFGADMKVTLTNDGPVTFWLRVAPAGRGAAQMG